MRQARSTRRACRVRGTGQLALPAAAVWLLVSGCTGGSDASSGESKASEPAAAVQSVTAAVGSLSPVAVAWGTTTSAAGHTRVVVMPHEGTISAVVVHNGDSVRADQPLLVIAIAPAAATLSEQARSALKFAEQDLARVQRLFADKLATNDQVATARKALADAQAQMDEMKKTGADQPENTLRAPFAGVITALNATPGDRPPSGTPIATVSSRSDAIVQLGLEPADAARLAPGARVRLQLPGTGDEIVTKLAAVGAALDATSRLVRAVAPIPAADSGRVTLGSTLEAHIDLPAHQGIIVPRGALLEDAEGPYVFTVVQAKAHRQPVQIAVETDDQALIQKGIDAGAQVIVEGNVALEDGIAVDTTKSAGTGVQPAEAGAAPARAEARP